MSDVGDSNSTIERDKQFTGLNWLNNFIWEANSGTVTVLVNNSENARHQTVQYYPQPNSSGLLDWDC